MSLKPEDIISLVHSVNTRSRERQLSVWDLTHIAEGIKSSGYRQAAATLYKGWIAFNSSDPQLKLAYFNYSVVLRELDDLEGAINALRECLRLDPEFAPARINLGRALEDCGQLDFAVEQWQQHVDATPALSGQGISYKLMALQHIGRTLEGSDTPERAEKALREAIELRPDKTEAAQHWIALRQRQCKWPTLEETELVSKKQLLAAMSPMSLASYADDPMFQLAKAHRYNRTLIGQLTEPPLLSRHTQGSVDMNGRLRIGYVSSDLREHAVGFALSELLELHDKERFEIFAYYCGGAETNDPTQQRIKAAVDHWRDISGIDDRSAATQIFQDKIHILIDVNGYTKHARAKIFAYRPVPVIVNWCGYPGTMGSPYHQYIIADPQIIPPENEIYYSEKVLRIACNQPVDRKRRIGDVAFTRALAGLPENTMVFACFNGMQKLTSACFDRWMKVLREAQDSVLWILTGDEGTNSRLQAAAAERGVNPQRILFAPKIANPVHLARLPLADLLLDTFPYGAHSTAADALTMGLPVLTIPGKSFASRFCSSVVKAAGLEDLICANEEEYVERAVEIANNPEKRRYYRDLLLANRPGSVLRNIPGLIHDLESAFEQMRSDYVRGATPTPDLSNLDVYFEIGAQLVEENPELMSADAYQRKYVEMLARWSEHTPIKPNQRFWRLSGAP